MGMMDKIWDDVFAGSQTNAPRETRVVNRSASGVPKLPREITVPSDECGGEGSLSHSASLSYPPNSPTEDVVNPKDEAGSLRGPRSTSQHIPAPAVQPPRRASLDSARSLPTGFRYMPDLLSPGATARREENVWRSVFQPGTNHAMDGMGSSKFDKANPKAPSVYDWYNPLST